ncbi:MAG: hypothetical protein ACXWQO_09340, partial [Bdellovibrionota bacterium]
NSVGAAKSFNLSGPDGGEALGWKIYTEALSAAGNPYHHVDLLRKIISADLVDVNFELLSPQANDSELPASLLSGEEGLRIAICVGSLETAELEAILQGISALSFSREVFLVGTIKDKKKSSEVISHWDGQLAIHDLCGRLSLNGWAQVMRTADVCLTSPGSSALMSSGYGTFVVCFDNNPARGPLHYPYGHGHLVVQAAAGQDFCASLALVTGDILSYAVSANSGSVPTLDQWQSFADARLEHYLSKIRLHATQRIETILGEGKSLTEMYLRPLVYLGSEAGDVMETFYRLLWEHSLNARTLTSNDIEILHQDTIGSLRSLLTPLEKLFELSRFGGNYCLLTKQALAAGNIERAQEESAKLQEVEELIGNIGNAFPLLSPLTSFHVKCQSHIPDLDALSLADEMSEVFSDLQSRVLVMLDLAKTLFHTTFQKESAQLAESKSSLVEGLSNG